MPTEDRPHARQREREYTVYDRSLITAKQNNRVVSFFMADGSEFHDCLILSVDRFAIEVNSDRKMWIHKGFIIKTEIAE